MVIGLINFLGCCCFFIDGVCSPNNGVRLLSEVVVVSLIFNASTSLDIEPHTDVVGTGAGAKDTLAGDDLGELVAAVEFAVLVVLEFAVLVVLVFAADEGAESDEAAGDCDSNFLDLDSLVAPLVSLTGPLDSLVSLMSLVSLVSLISFDSVVLVVGVCVSTGASFGDLPSDNDFAKAAYDTLEVMLK